MCAWHDSHLNGSRACARLMLPSKSRMRPVVETLLERGFNVYAINPKQLASLRAYRFDASGDCAKDDKPRCIETLASSGSEPMAGLFRQACLRLSQTLVELRDHMIRASPTS